jgi:2-hydroxychromene-2-carboxylate isomerase
MPGQIDFYFDFISPFTYLAYHELPKVVARHGYALIQHPVELNELKRGNNNTGPSNREQPLKRRYNQQEFRRWTKRYGVTFQRPIRNRGSTRAHSWRSIAAASRIMSPLSGVGAGAPAAVWPTKG